MAALPIRNDAVRIVPKPGNAANHRVLLHLLADLRKSGDKRNASSLFRASNRSSEGITVYLPSFGSSTDSLACCWPYWDVSILTVACLAREVSISSLLLNVITNSKRISDGLRAPNEIRRYLQCGSAARIAVPRRARQCGCDRHRHHWRLSAYYRRVKTRVSEGLSLLGVPQILSFLSLLFQNVQYNRRTRQDCSARTSRTPRNESHGSSHWPRWYLITRTAGLSGGQLRNPASKNTRHLT